MWPFRRILGYIYVCFFFLTSWFYIWGHNRNDLLRNRSIEYLNFICIKWNMASRLAKIHWQELHLDLTCLKQTFLSIKSNFIDVTADLWSISVVNVSVYHSQVYMKSKCTCSWFYCEWFISVSSKCKNFPLTLIQIFQ